VKFTIGNGLLLTNNLKRFLKLEINEVSGDSTLTVTTEVKVKCSSSQIPMDHSGSAQQ
jgi:hypothetical protein